MINKYVKSYIDDYKSGRIKFNKERRDLVTYLEKIIFPKIESGEVYFDDEQIEQANKFIEKWYFKLQPFQKFFIAFIFLYEKNGHAYYNEFLMLMARGAGKNGLISGISHYLMSELHGIANYDGSIVANSERQAKTSFEEIYEAIGGSDTLSKAFYRTKLRILANGTNAKLEYHTANPNTKDGLRDGFVIFDEIHQYENSKLVNVYLSGMGKRKHPRIFYIGTDGYVRDGFLDGMKETAKNILAGEHPDSRMLPFICKLDDEKEVNNVDDWEKANPMFSKPLTEYSETLLRTVKSEFDKFDYDSTSRAEFMTKRMNLPEEDLQKIVATWEDILKTNQPWPLIQGKTAIVGVDYASVKDFAAIGFLIRVDDKYVWHSHSFARKEFLDKVSLGPPIKEWEKEGYLTIVDAPTIAPERLVEWLDKEAKRLNLKVHKVMVDRFRFDITRPAFEGAGFEVEPLNYMPSIHAQIAPRIETIFSNHQVVWGDNPLMRWYTNNTAVNIKKDGNKEFIKKDPIRRKTDGFHAFLHALYRSDEIVNKDINKSINQLDALLG